ncbi:amidohydrolase [Kaistella palustris]|uniref:amidohydrolase n=1 Tax=Kaistella palustris TaxID=493376 RepID=UPI00040F2789|nr:amidohydrolase [Kaistella palustris]
MNNNLKIAALSYDIIWADIEANLENIVHEIRNINADLIVLPEMFATGFNMKPDEIADRTHQVLNWMKKCAAEKNVAICGSVSVSENGQFYNRFYFVEADGINHQYDKRHLFSYSGEDKVYTQGNERVIINFKGCRILLQVCYDLRFPVFSRNSGDYDAILYVANWPDSRIDAWEILLRARAVENQAYVFGVNRVGTDGNNLKYTESTFCFFADGNICSAKNGNIINAEFNAEKLAEFRRKFHFLDDRDSFKIL